MTEKVKNSPSRMRTLPFLALWTASHIGAWLFTLWLWEAGQVRYDDYVLNALFVSLVPGMIAAAGQGALMTSGLKKPVKPWLLTSFAGYLLSAAAYYVYLNSTSVISDSIAMMLSILFVPAAVVQAVWLHSRVKSAWLWVVGAVVSAVLFALPLDTPGASMEMQYVLVTLAAVLQGVVTGSVMRHLWTQERDKTKNEKAKVDTLEAEASTRLEENFESDNTIEDAPERAKHRKKYGSDGKT
jgi:drug/metabolite transporter (DMT)-like permease